MAYQIPSLATLGARAWAAFRAELFGTDALAKPNTLAVHAKVLALVLRPVHERLAWLYRQIFASTADAEHLERRHGYELGMPRKAAGRAAGPIETTGTPLATYPAGVRFLAGSALYLATAAATADGAGDVTFQVRAQSAGAAGNLDAGATLTVADPGTWPALGPTVTVAAGGLGGGADLEDLEVYRARILDRKRSEPQGGSYGDYERWAREVPGVLRAWAAPATGDPGVIALFFTFADRTNGIPEAGDVAAVEAYLAARRQIRRGLMVAAPTAVPVAVTISDLDPDTVAVRGAISDALVALFAGPRIRPGLPGDPFTLSRSWIGEAVSRAAGEAAHVLTLPAADATFTAGQMPVLGVVTFA